MMLIESVGHKFRQDTVGIVWSWDHLKTYLHVWLMEAITGTSTGAMGHNTNKQSLQIVWVSWPHGDWLPRVGTTRERAGQRPYWHLWPSLEVRQHDFHPILFLLRQSWSSTSVQGEDNRLCFLMGSGEVLEQLVGPEILLWPLLEITVCYN